MRRTAKNNIYILTLLSRCVNITGIGDMKPVTRRELNVL